MHDQYNTVNQLKRDIQDETKIEHKPRKSTKKPLTTLTFIYILNGA